MSGFTIRPDVKSRFASDNSSGICPEAWDAIARANHGYVPGYGNDPWTARACDLLRELFEIDCDVFFTFNGTAANSLAIAHLCTSYQSVICHEMAHVETDECGGPEFFTHGTKLLLAKGDNGKLTPASVVEIVNRRTDVHFPRPRVLSLTQSTEAGTLYSVDELDALSETARRSHLHVHMDGARFANAIAGLNGIAPKEITWKVGVDVLCFGGTKNGMPVGEAVIVFDRKVATGFEYRCKQAGQLASKMRFLAAPWVGMLEGGGWLANGRTANAAARRLALALRGIPGVRVMFPTEANAVFLDMPAAWVDALRERGWRFYTFIGGGARFMCSWATRDEDVDELVTAVREVAGLSPVPAAVGSC